jgi:hypothetical protein
VDQVAGLDHAPLATLVTVGFSQNAGSPPGTPFTIIPWSCAIVSCADAGTASAKPAIRAPITRFI